MNTTAARVSVDGPPAPHDPGALGMGRAVQWIRGCSPVVVVMAAILLLLIVPPLYFLIKTSFHTTNFDGSFGHFTLRYYANLFSTPRFGDHLVNTAIFAAGSAILAIVLGAAQAWIVERTDTPLRHYVFLIAVISLGIPHVLYTVAWLLILGKGGPVNAVLMGLLGTDRAILNFYSMWGMILVEGFIWAPLGFLLLSSVFRSADASFEEASMMSGAGIFTTFRHITLRLSTPALLALVMLVFIRAFEAFDIPALVGGAGGISVLTTDIFDSIRKDLPANYGQAGAFSMVLLGVVILMLYGHNRLARNAERYHTITGKGFRPRVIRLGRWRYLTASFLVLLFIVLLVLPVSIIVLASLLPFYEGVSLDALRLLTLDNFVQVAESGSFRESILNTLIMGAATATFVCAITAISAWFAVRRRNGGWLLDQLATLPLIFPAIVLGVAFLHVFLSLPMAIYGTLFSIIIASVVRYLPYGMRFCYAGVLQIHGELEEASAISGARGIATFARIVLPLIAPALMTSWLFVLLMSVRAVAMPILLAGPNSQVVAVTLFDLWINGQVVELAAVGVTWTGLMTVVGIVFYATARRYGLTVQ